VELEPGAGGLYAQGPRDVARMNHLLMGVVRSLERGPLTGTYLLLRDSSGMQLIGCLAWSSCGMCCMGLSTASGALQPM
jgi:hypothetical protein